MASEDAERGRVDVLLFDGFDEVDAVGPYEVLANGGLDVAMVALGGPRQVVASHGLRVAAAAPRADAGVLVVPGGGWASDDRGGGVRRAAQDPATLALVRERAARGDLVTSVCTGALLLASAGLLDGRPATTHHTALDDLASFGADVRREVPYVDDGDVVTAAGVVNGIAMALHLVERLRGPEAVAEVRSEMQLPGS